MQNGPSCNHPERKVKRVTLESLLRPERRVDIGDGPYHVCLTPECGTVYFGAGDTATFVKSDLSVRFGLKETEPPRPVCYCFNHSIEGIHDEIRRTGRSTVLDSIKAAMKGHGSTQTRISIACSRSYHRRERAASTLPVRCPKR